MTPPWQQLLYAIGGVVLISLPIVYLLNWALRFDPGGPFSQLITQSSVVWLAVIGLLAGGLLVAANWFFELFDDNF